MSDAAKESCMRKDPDLEFLKDCDNDDLGMLIDYLCKNKEGNARWNEYLTCTESYKKYNPDHKMYWEIIAGELQTYGGNTIMNMLRLGDGVPYRKILLEVSKKMKVNFNKDSAIEVIELNLLMKILTGFLEKMTSEQLKEIIEETGIKTTSFTAESVAASLQIAIRMGGFLPYKISIIVASVVSRAVLGRGLSLATMAFVPRMVSLVAGPIGWALTALWTLCDIAGPAYRITIPAVIQVAYMRTKLAAKTNGAL